MIRESVRLHHQGTQFIFSTHSSNMNEVNLNQNMNSELDTLQHHVTEAMLHYLQNSLVDERRREKSRKLTHTIFQFKKV